MDDERVTWPRVVGGLVVLVAIVAIENWESKADKDRKPDASALTLDNSMARCDFQGRDPEAYRTTMAERLSHTFTAAMETLNTRDITVCFDERLPGTSRFLGRTIIGSYYPADGTHKGVVTMHEGFNYYGYQVLDKLPRYLDRKDYQGMQIYASRYSDSDNNDYTDWGHGYRHTQSQIDGIKGAPLRLSDGQ